MEYSGYETFDLHRSPVRQNLAQMQEGELSLFDLDENDPFLKSERAAGLQKLQVKVILDDIENILDTVRRNAGGKTKLAVMGEVKAGKSTFINACLEKEAAYTDVLEATALVSEIVWSEQEYAHVLGQDGSVLLDMTLEELLDWMEEQVDEEADFSAYSKIEVGVNSPLLENAVLVDTPGLLSITTKNHDMTHQYIAQADFVLWAISSRDLGSAAVNEYIRKIQASGKPLIGIVTKVDTPEIKDEIMGYVQEQFGTVFEEIFYVSATEACTLQAQGVSDWAARTGFDQVLECIADLGEDKEHSTRKTLYYQFQRERELHQKLREVIGERKEYYNQELKVYAESNRQIKNTVSTELRRWLANDFYCEERKQILDSELSKVEELVQKFGDIEYFNEQVQQKKDEISGYIYRSWDVMVKSLAAGPSRVLIDFTYQKDLSGLAEDGASQADLGKHISKGLKGGTMIGMIFAGYSAWLGPAASYVTFTQALVPAVVPLALAGAAVTAFLGVNSDRAKRAETAKQRLEVADDLYRFATGEARKYLSQMEQQLHQCSDDYYNQQVWERVQIARSKGFDFTEPAYSDFMERLDRYIEDLSAAAEGCREDTQPPLEQDE